MRERVSERVSEREEKEEKKGFVNLTPWSNAIKLFLAITNCKGSLAAVFVTVNHFNPSLTFGAKTKDYLSGAH